MVEEEIHYGGAWCCPGTGVVKLVRLVGSLAEQMALILMVVMAWTTGVLVEVVVMR